MQKVVLDTNVLLVSISRKSPLHWIFQKLLDEAYEICVTTEILLEYEEIITQKMGKRASEAAMGILENLNNVVYITTYYEFELLADPDDNKFVDCAIASGANFIVSEDTDFNALENIDFPKVNIINVKEFRAKIS